MHVAHLHWHFVTFWVQIQWRATLFFKPSEIDKMNTIWAPESMQTTYPTLTPLWNCWSCVKIRNPNFILLNSCKQSAFKMSTQNSLYSVLENFPNYLCESIVNSLMPIAESVNFPKHSFRIEIYLNEKIKFPAAIVIIQLLNS